jgi:hypothetical protein
MGRGEVDPKWASGSGGVDFWGYERLQGFKAASFMIASQPQANHKPPPCFVTCMAFLSTTFAKAKCCCILIHKDFHCSCGLRSLKLHAIYFLPWFRL